MSLLPAGRLRLVETDAAKDALRAVSFGCLVRSDSRLATFRS